MRAASVASASERPGAPRTPGWARGWFAPLEGLAERRSPRRCQGRPAAAAAVGSRRELHCPAHPQQPRCSFNTTQREGAPHCPLAADAARARCPGAPRKRLTPGHTRTPGQSGLPRARTSNRRPASGSTPTRAPTAPSLRAEGAPWAGMRVGVCVGAGPAVCSRLEPRRSVCGYRCCCCRPTALRRGLLPCSGLARSGGVE